MKQKSRLPDLFKDVERPQWSKPSTTRVFLLNSDFVLAWRGEPSLLILEAGGEGGSASDQDLKIFNSLRFCERSECREE